jgi:CHAT domain-containing protein
MNIKMKYLLLGVISILLLSNYSSAQNKEIDSLRILITKSSIDTNKIILENKISELFWRKTMLDSSSKYAELALSHSQGIKYNKGEASALSNHGVISEYSGDFDKASQYYQKSLIIHERINNKTGISSSYSNLGTVNLSLGNFTLAHEYYLKALEIRKSLNDKIGIAYLYNNLGITNSYLGKDNESLDYFIKSLEIKEELKNKKGLASAYNNVGRVYSNQGKKAEALIYYNKSYEIYKEFDDKKGISVYYINTGNLHRDNFNHEEAIDYYKKSLRLREEIEDKPGIAQCYNNISSTYFKMYEFEKAIYNQKISLNISETIGDKSSVIISYLNLGAMYNGLGDSKKSKDSIEAKKKYFELSLNYYQEYLKLQETINDFSEYNLALANIGTAYLSLNKIEEAIKYSTNSFNKSKLKIYSPELDVSTRSLYICYLRQMELDSAFQYLNLFKQNTDNELKRKYFTLSEFEKEKYFSNIEQNYSKYYEFATVFKKEFPLLSDSVYNMALKNKGLTLKSSTLLRQSISKSGDTTLVNKYESWLQLKKNIVSLHQSGHETKQMDSVAREMEKKLVKKSSLFRDFDNAYNLDWKQVKSGLKPNEAAIEFIHYKCEIDSTNPTRYIACIITSESEHPVIVPLCTESEISEILNLNSGNNQTKINQIYGNINESNSRLYEKIWKPLEKDLSKIKTIYFSPTGILNRISFSSISQSKEVLLCDQFQLNQLSSTGKIVLNENTTFSNTDNYFLLGGVNYNSDSTSNQMWNFLPGTLSETNQIKLLLEKKKYHVYTFQNDVASEENFKTEISKAEIAHISTHGFFFSDPKEKVEETKAIKVNNEKIKFRSTTDYADWSFVKNENPLMRSGLILARANDIWERDPLEKGEDGILTAQEVSNLDLNKLKLVVLSACETGLGDIKGSEGVYGLQRAFKMAGAKYIIMSLWQVPDEETSEFMQLFYKNLLKDKNVRMAFNKTQKVMRAKYDPYFWGAFVLIE